MSGTSEGAFTLEGRRIFVAAHRGMVGSAVADAAIRAAHAFARRATIARFGTPRSAEGIEQDLVVVRAIVEDPHLEPVEAPAFGE